MIRIPLRHDDDTPLAEQIVRELCRLVEERQLPPGGRVPSIRALAAQCGVSRFTVVEAYDRLAAQGVLLSRRGAGFYVAPAPGTAPPAASDDQTHNETLVRLIRRLLEAEDGATPVGGPWLPNAWLGEAGIRHALNALARRNGAFLPEYGQPLGSLKLREQLALMLSGLGIPAHPQQLLLTHGTSQALELVTSGLLRPGDTALVDDPGSYAMFGTLRLHGIEMLAVPRHRDGPDIAALEQLAGQRHPRLYFTQSVLQNPTGTTMSPRIAFQVLRAAERYDLLVVEDDIFCDLEPAPGPRLATLDQLNRVIYLRSYSKTLSGSLRVGFVAARQDLVERLAEAKLLAGSSNAQLAERLLYRILADGQYRKFLGRLHARLADARTAAIRGLEQAGLEIFAEPRDGMFVWARFPHVADSLALAEAARAHGLLLAPGTAFRPHLEASPWMRFNVAMCADPAIAARLARLGREAAE